MIMNNYDKVHRFEILQYLLGKKKKNHSKKNSYRMNQKLQSVITSYIYFSLKEKAAYVLVW